MFNINLKDRCKKCKVERALRLCPRANQGLCWRCCNALRVDLKCPADCPYAGKLIADNPMPAFKADNIAEMQQVIKRHIDLWVHKSREDLDHQSPAEYAEAHPDDMLKWLTGFQYPDYFPLDYLMRKLELDLEPPESGSNPEDVAAEYISHIIALEYDELLLHTMNASSLPELQHRYADLLSTVPFLKKVKSYSFIHTARSEDGAQCVVFMELNHKQEWCLILRQEDGKWYVRQNINGNPSLYFKQNALYEKIAGHLANSEDQKAYFEIAEALRSYVDSADLYYYRALYWLLVKQQDNAKVDLFNAIALDNHFTPPYMHLGLIYLNEKNYAEARLWFAAMAEIDPENPDAANNLAIATLAEGDKDAAIALWKLVLQKHPTYEMARKNLELYG